jgi:hypothetical protein
MNRDLQIVGLKCGLLTPTEKFTNHRYQDEIPNHNNFRSSTRKGLLYIPDVKIDSKW